MKCSPQSLRRKLRHLEHGLTPGELESQDRRNAARRAARAANPKKIGRPRQAKCIRGHDRTNPDNLTRFGDCRLCVPLRGTDHGV